MQRRPEYLIEDNFHGYRLFTDGKVFYAKDEQGNRGTDSPSLDACKSKVLKPTALDIQAVILQPDGYRYYSDDEEDNKPERVRVYGVTGAGAILYERANGKKDKTSRYDRGIRRLDELKLEQYISLTAEQRRIKAELEALLESWPELKAAELRECPESAK